MKAEIAFNGPISCGMGLSNDFIHYQDGVLSKN